MGGTNNKQYEAFVDAVVEVKNALGDEFFEVETLTVKELREDPSWTIKAVVNWLLDCHIHCILAHPHQGTKTFQWPVLDLYFDLQRLKFHTGK